MRFKITENRLFAPALLETNDGDEALDFVLNRAECRIYRDGINIAIVIVENGYLYFRCDKNEYRTLADIFKGDK